MIKIKKNCTLETTWKELKDDIEAASNPLNVGDEIDIVLKTGEKVTLVCEQVKDKRATFFTKDLLEETNAMDEGWITGYKKHLSTMDLYLKKLFRLLPDDLQEVASPLRLLREREVFGRNIYGKPEDCEQLPRYQEPQNRIKLLGGEPYLYWLASPCANYTAFCLMNGSGSSSFGAASYSNGVCFGFDI